MAAFLSWPCRGPWSAALAACPGEDALQGIMNKLIIAAKTMLDQPLVKVPQGFRKIT
jgi:hypothetical protein